MPLAADTPASVEARQVAAWRQMNPADKAAMVAAMTRASRQMMLAGLRHRHPGASDREIFLRAAIVQLGPALAVAAFPDAAPFIAP